jgi:hypothetical protein
MRDFIDDFLVNKLSSLLLRITGIPVESRQFKSEVQPILMY